MTNPIKYLLALRFCEGIGHITARRLLSAFGSADAVFNASHKDFMAVSGTTERLYRLVQSGVNWTAVEAETDFLNRSGVRCVCITDPEYPSLLSGCYDAPFLLFYSGELTPGNKKNISIVGTRSATEYGKQVCRELVEGLVRYNPVIVSGLAYGIDITAHKAALDYGLSTHAVVAHGLNMVYPSAHKTYAEKIKQSGALISEFCSLDNPDKENFPKRNRIIAGISQATVVIEASEKGGALITAKLAAGYNRDVFAYPGRANDRYSKGCNQVIKNNEAILIESAEDLIHHLNWENNSAGNHQKHRLILPDMSEEELSVIRLMEERGLVSIDGFASSLPFSPSKIATLLLGLEMKGAIHSHPGKIYGLG